MTGQPAAGTAAARLGITVCNHPGGTSTSLSLERFQALTFDCYGTLIDWESGLLAAYRRVLDAHAASPPDEDLLQAHARHEARWEAGRYLAYREVLSRTLRDVCAERGIRPSEEQAREFASSVAEWPAFPDSREALATLGRRFSLGVITNCDDDLFEHSCRRLGVAFDWVVTAQQAGSYKPALRNFELALGKIGLPREHVLHVAQSLFHDHVPAKHLGLTTVWIDRRHDQQGGGATPPARAQPDLRLPDLASFAALSQTSPGPA